MVFEAISSSIIPFGMLGVFLSNFLGSILIMLPNPSMLVTFAAGAVFDPLLVGVVAGVGAALGQIVVYGFGLGGRKIFKGKVKPKKYWKKWTERIESWMQSYGGFALVLLFAATPLPDGPLALVCGSIKYDIKKYFVAVLIGKLILCIAIAYAGFFGIGLFLDWFF